VLIIICIRRENNSRTMSFGILLWFSTTLEMFPSVYTVICTTEELCHFDLWFSVTTRHCIVWPSSMHCIVRPSSIHCIVRPFSIYCIVYTVICTTEELCHFDLWFSVTTKEKFEDTKEVVGSVVLLQFRMKQLYCDKIIRMT
jgi:hypothetical protein